MRRHKIGGYRVYGSHYRKSTNEVSGCQYVCYATIAINVNWLALKTLVFMFPSLSFTFAQAKFRTVSIFMTCSHIQFNLFENMPYTV